MFSSQLIKLLPLLSATALARTISIPNLIAERDDSSIGNNTCLGDEKFKYLVFNEFSLTVSDSEDYPENIQYNWGIQIDNRILDSRLTQCNTTVYQSRLTTKNRPNNFVTEIDCDNDRSDHSTHKLYQEKPLRPSGQVQQSKRDGSYDQGNGQLNNGDYSTEFTISIDVPRNDLYQDGSKQTDTYKAIFRPFNITGQTQDLMTGTTGNYLLKTQPALEQLKAGKPGFKVYLSSHANVPVAKVNITDEDVKLQCDDDGSISTVNGGNSGGNQDTSTEEDDSNGGNDDDNNNGGSSSNSNSYYNGGNGNSYSNGGSGSPDCTKPKNAQDSKCASYLYSYCGASASNRETAVCKKYTGPLKCGQGSPHYPQCTKKKNCDAHPEWRVCQKAPDGSNNGYSQQGSQSYGS